MATWGPFTTNGNTTQSWVVSGGNITNFESFVCQLDTTSPSSTSTGAELAAMPIGYINPTRYVVSVSAKGPQAIQYHIKSNQI